MEDDKRAEAMRRAIAESDALRAKSAKSVKSDGSSSGKMKQVMGPVKKYAGKAKDFILKLWVTTAGKVGLIAGAVVILLLIGSSMFSSGTDKTQAVKPTYEITDAGLSVYENPSVPSGYSYDAYIEVKNTGTTGLYLKDIMFLVETESGDRMALDSHINIFPAVIEPGQTGYLFNTFGTAVEDGVPQVGQALRMQPKFVVSKSEASPHRYDVKDVSLLPKDEGGYALSCNVVNDTNAMVSMMHAVVIVYDQNGHCIGISSGFLSNVGAMSSALLRLDITMMAGKQNELIADYAILVY